MSEQRPRALEGWGQIDPNRGNWRRNRDWVGRHTILSLLLGAAAAALLGVAIMEFVAPLSATPQGDVAAVEEEAMQRSFAAAWEGALAAAIAQARTTAIAERIIERGAGGDAEWAAGFREGWAAGWNDALEAMRQASQEAGLPERAPEFYILENTPRR